MPWPCCVFGVLMLKVSAIERSFGGRTVLARVSFVVNDGQVTGLVGPNGAGKTTLLRIIAGELTPDAGSAQAGGVIGYLRQGHAQESVRRACEVFPAAFAAERASQRLEALAAELASAGASAPDALHAEYDALSSAVALADHGVIEEAWAGLRLRPVDPEEPLGRLSGGEQTKLGLIDLIALRPDTLLLDEPTNNLDLPALAWLDEFLDTFAGPVIAVSHDRRLLDDHAEQIIELDPRKGEAQVFAGNYTAYGEEKARREAELWARYRRQEEHEAALRREIRAIGDTARRRERMSQNDYYRGRNKKFARRGVMLRRRLERELRADEHIEKPAATHHRVKAEMAPVARGGDRLLAATGLTLQAGGLTVLRDADLAIGRGERVVLTGANGAGKTTLLRALLDPGMRASGAVRQAPSCVVGYLPQVEDAPEDAAFTPVEVVRGIAPLSETEARRFLHRFLFSGEGAVTPVGRLSYGERRRLSLAKVVLGGANLLLLDEPTNHLDIPSREAFEAGLESYSGAMLAVTHDRYFIERFGERMLALEDGILREE